jgi:folate-binding protein YgfZ
MTNIDPTIAARESAAVFDVSDRGAVEVSGKDAAVFLHNLCTNDIKSLVAGHGCEFFLTTNKARVIAHGWVHRLTPEKPPTLWLDVSPGAAVKVLQHLNRFIVSEQVELADKSADRAQLHICGPAARPVVEKTLTASLPELKDRQHEVLPGGVRVIRHELLGLPGYDLVCDRPIAMDLKKRFEANGAALLGQDAFEILRMEAGLPLDGVDMDENRFVVEVGRIRQAISYTKGCFLGQEPIVMARDRGHANRTLMGLKISASEPVPRGAVVMHNGQEVGHVTSSVWSPRLRTVLALAYLKRGSQEAGTPLQVVGRSGIVAALPFA